MSFFFRDVGVLGVEVPFLAPTNTPMTSVTWNFTTTPQTSLDNRVLTYPRGRVLGGSSSISEFTRVVAGLEKRLFITDCTFRFLGLYPWVE